MVAAQMITQKRIARMTFSVTSSIETERSAFGAVRKVMGAVFSMTRNSRKIMAIFWKEDAQIYWIHKKASPAVKQERRKAVRAAALKLGARPSSS